MNLIKKKILNNPSSLLALLFALALSPATLATSNQGLTYQGRIVRPDGSVINTGTISFSISIYSPSPSRCLLYSETQNVNMTGSQGLFSLTVGAGTRVDPGAHSFNQVFINNATLSGLTCSSGTSYAASGTDDRDLAVSFNDAGTVVTLSDMKIKSVPFALQAHEVDGWGINNLVKVSTLGSPTTFTTTEMANAKALAGAACALNEILKWNGSAWACASDATGGAPVDASFAAKGIVQGDTDAATSGLTFTSGVIKVNAGTAANQIVKLDSSAKLPGVDGSALTNLDPTHLSAAVPINKGGTGQITAILGFNALSPITTKGDLITSDGTNNVRLPAGSNGYVLTADSAQSSGIKWAPVTAGTVTSVSSANADISVATPTSTPVLTLNSGTGANQIVKLDGSAKLPAIDGSQLTNIAATSYSGVLPIANGGTNSSTALNDNRVMVSASGKIVEAAAMTNGQLLIGSTGAAPVVATLGVANGISVTTGAGTLSIGTNATSTNTASTIVSRDASGNFAASAITNSSNILKGATSGTLTMTVPTTVTSYTLTWPNAVGGAGSFLTTDASGNLSWGSPAAIADSSYSAKGAVQFLTDAATSGITISSGVANVNSGTGANQIVKLDGSAKLPGVDGSALTNLDPTHLSAAVAINKGGTGQTTQTAGFNALSPLTTKGDLITSDGTNNIRVPAGTDGYVLQADSAQTGGVKWAAASAGTVTSVSSANSDISVATGTSTPVLTLNSGTSANQIVKLDGSAKLPAVDGSALTNLNAGNISSGTLPIARGGTAATSFAANAVIVSNGTGSALQALNCTSGQVITFDVSGYAVCGAAAGANGFVDGGNSFGANATLGTNDNYSLSIKTNNTPRMTILSTGEVGIGTTSPANKLHIVGDGNSLFMTPATSTNGVATYMLNAGNGSLFGIESSSGGALILGSTPYASVFGTQSARPFQIGTNNAVRMTVDSAGYVGIGTTAPANTLEVKAGSSNASGLRFTNLNSGSTKVANNNTVLNVNSSGDVQMSAPALPFYDIDGNTSATEVARDYNSVAALGTNVAISDVMSPMSNGPANLGWFTAVYTVANKGSNLYTSQFALSDLGAAFRGGQTSNINSATWNKFLTVPAANGFYFSASSSDINMNNADNGALILSTNNTERMRILAGGNIGIANSSPGALLDLGNAGSTLGTMRLEGDTSGYVQIQPSAAAGSWTMTLPANAGTNGYVLSTNGSGVTSWIPAGGGGSVTSVSSANTDIAVATGTSTPVLTLNSGTSANQIVKLDGSAKLPAVDGSALTNLDPTHLSAAVPINKGGTGQITAVLGFNALSPITTKGDLITSDGTNNIRLPAGTDGYVLQTDSTQSSGLKWALANAGTVTAVSSANGDISVATGTSTPVLTLNSGTSANQIVKLDGSAKLPAVDGSALTNLNAGNISSGTLPVTRGGTGNTTFGNNGVIVSNGTGSALQSLNCTSGQVITFDVSGYAICGSNGGSSFVNGGNSFGSNATLGTNDNYSLGIKTNNATRISILSTGEVGIGTTSPASTLDVKGSVASGTALTAANTDTTTANNGIQGSTTSAISGATGVYGTATGAGYVNGVYGYTPSGYGIGVYGKSAAGGGGSAGVFGRSTYSGGNSVYGGYFTAVSTGASAGVYAEITSASNTGYGVYAYNASANGWGVYSGGASPNYFKGSVGVGTTSPGATLDVVGNVKVSNTITTASTELVLEQTGDTLGTTRLRMRNRSNSNGAIFENAAVDLVDFGFLPSSGASSQNNLRLEHRTANMANSANTTGEFQFINTPNTGVPWFASGPKYTSVKTGNFGVGTATPAGILDVQGGTATSGNGTSINIVAQSGFTTGNNNGGSINLTAGSANGTGTAGTVNVNQNGLNFVGGTGGGGGAPVSGMNGIYSSGLNRLDFATNGTNRFSVLGNGNVVMGSPTTKIVGNNFMDYNVNANGFAMDDTNAYMKTAGSIRVSVDYTGNVGIGVTTPTTKLQIGGDTTPSVDNTYQMGNSSLRFSAVYAVNGTIQTSDARMKKNVQNSDLGLDFITKLRPVSYNWRTGADKDLHYGLIAQETEKAILDAHPTQPNEGTPIVDHDPKTDRYGLRYSELISPVIKALQELYAKVLGVESEQSRQAREIATVQSENQELKTENQRKDQKIQELEKRLERLEKAMQPR